MSGQPNICFTFAGDVTRDSRLRRMAEAAVEVGNVTVLQLRNAEREAGVTGDAREKGEGIRERKADEPGGLPYNVVDIVMPGPLRKVLPRSWRYSSYALRKIGATLCVASDLYTLPGASRAARVLRVPLLYDARELYCAVAALDGRPLMQRFWTAVERRYGKRTRTILTVNNAIADNLRGWHGDVRVLRNLPDFPPVQASDRLREALGIPVTRRVLLSQGGLQAGRGALKLVDAMPELPRCDLVFLGDGPLRGDIEASAAFAGVADRVHVLPAVPSHQLHEWTASADLGFCLIENLGQSYYLSLPNKLFEYIAAGVPVVGSDFPEIGAMLRETGTGIAIDPENPDLLVRAVRTLLDDDGRYARAVAACATAAREYHWDKEKEKFVGLLREVVGKAVGRRQ